jgi:hypothetical protein
VGKPKKNRFPEKKPKKSREREITYAFKGYGKKIISEIIRDCEGIW